MENIKGNNMEKPEWLTINEEILLHLRTIHKIIQAYIQVSLPPEKVKEFFELVNKMETKFIEVDDENK
jgi:hypothetical protein